MKFYAQTQEFTLDNGIKIFVLPRPGSGVEVQCCVQTGSIHEGKDLGCGLSHFLEHMLFQGCRNFPGRSASDAIEKLGGSINAYTSFDHTVFHSQLAARHVGKAIEIIGNMVRYPELPEERFLKERDVILRECDMTHDRPESRLFEKLFDTMFLHHPAQVPIIGYRDQIAAVTRDMARDYHARRYAPGRIFWVIVGGVEPEFCRDKIAEIHGDWAHHHLAEVALPQVPDLQIQRHCEVVFADSLSRLGAFFRMPDTFNAETAAVEIMLDTLGSSSGSILVRELEKKRQLALDIEAFDYTLGSFTIGGFLAQCTPSKVPALEKALFAELDKVQKNGITPAEILSAKRQKYADLVRTLRYNSSVASSIITSVRLTGTPQAADQALNIFQKIEVDAVLQAAKKYLTPENFTVVVQKPQSSAAKHTATAATPIRPQSANLNSGAQIVTLTDHQLPLITFHLMLPGGAIVNPAHQNGVSNLVSELLLTGGKKLPEEKLCSALERYGADVSVVSGLNSFYIEMNAPRQYFKDAFKWLSRMITSSDFAAAPFEREKANLLEKITASRQKPTLTALFTVMSQLFPQHPYGYTAQGDRREIQALTAQEASDFYTSLFYPGQTVFGFAGDISPEEAQGFGEALSAQINWQTTPLALPAEPHFPTSDILQEIAIPREQCTVACGIPAPPLTTPDSMAVELLHLAENGLNSRLFERVREDNSLAYSVGLQLTGGLHPGALIFYANTTPQNIERVEELFAEEMARLRNEGLTAKEFAAAQEAAAYSSTQATESVHRAISDILLGLRYNKPLDALYQREEKIRNFKLAQANAIIAQVFDQPVKVRVHAGKLQASRTESNPLR